MKVDRMLLEQIRPHDHAHVGEGEKHFVILIKRNQWRRDIPVHDSNVHDLAGIHVPVETLRRRIRSQACIRRRADRNRRW